MGVRKWGLLIEGHNWVAIGVAQPDCDMDRNMADQVCAIRCNVTSTYSLVLFLMAY
jgi:hypothetical protein